MLARPSLGSWLLFGLGNESDELPGFVALCPRGLPTAQSRKGTHIDTETRGGQLVPNLTRNDVRAGSQRAQVQLTQFLNQRHAKLRAGDQRLESRIHSMELAF